MVIDHRSGLIHPAADRLGVRYSTVFEIDRYSEFATVTIISGTAWKGRPIPIGILCQNILTVLGAARKGRIYI